jgi:hypothetical protein
MLLMMAMAAISLVMIYAGLELNIRMKKVAYAFIYIAIGIFTMGVIAFAKRNLGFNVGDITAIIYTLVLSVIATIFIIRSCKTSYIVGRY